jgi:transcriptional regulator with XRE-family HTH domain
MLSKPVRLTPELLGARIAKALDTAGVSRELAADKIDKSRDTIDRYIRGKQNPSAIDVWTISQLTDHPFGWFGDVSQKRGAPGGPAQGDEPPDTQPTLRRRRKRGAQ